MRYFLALALLSVSTACFSSSPDLVKGSDIYNSVCVVCHGSDGLGNLQGMPNLTDSKGVLSLSTATLVSRVMKGYDDGNAPMAMPPKGNDSKLTPQDVRDVIAYMRHEFLKD